MNKRLQINIKVPQKDINFVSARLESCIDALSTFVSSGTEFWEINGITKTTSDEDEVNAVVKELVQKLNLQPTDFSIEMLPDRDWLAQNRMSFPRLYYSRFLIHGSHNRPKTANGFLNIELEAGRAFGSGNHESTAGCLFSLLHLFKIISPKRIMDLGCGSGILSIASVKLWPLAKTLALDIDYDAVKTTLENIKINKVWRQIRCKHSNGFPKARPGTSRKYDLIVANILAKPLVALAPHSSSFLRSGGHIVLSGLLRTQEREILAVYNSLGFRVVSRKRLKEWTTFIFKYKRT